ncbi:MAG: hypothetical protein L3J86_01160 [Thermoplasmata archaeon]|nr:hypothetical protein [Thermoplasmata archaeon]
METTPPPPRNDLLDRWGRRIPYQWAAPIALIAMSITFAELLTGSTPFLVLLLNPLSLPFLIGLYGGGVLAIREFSVRWNARWPSVLLLGAAYGILEEGFATRTFFDPSVAGYLGIYGHWAGVNWVWVVQLTLFHAIFSIALPIYLLGVLAPSTSGRPLLSRRGAVLALAATLSTASVMFFLFDHGYRPALGLLLLFGALALGFVAAARWPGLAPGGPTGRLGPARPRRMFALGAIGVSTFFALNWVGPFLIPIPAVLVLLELTVGSIVAAYAWREFRRNPQPVAIVALSAGLLSFLLLLASGLELAGDWGVGLVVVAVVGCLWILYRRTRTPSPVVPPGALAVARAPS